MESTDMTLGSFSIQDVDNEDYSYDYLNNSIQPYNFPAGPDNSVFQPPSNFDFGDFGNSVGGSLGSSMMSAGTGLLNMASDYLASDVAGSRGQDRRQDRRDRRQMRRDGFSRADRRQDRRDDKAERRQQFGYRGPLGGMREKRDIRQGRGMGRGAANGTWQRDGIPSQISTRTCPPLTCYQTCTNQMKEQTKLCREMNEDHLEEMKAYGCTGAKCSMPALNKSCRKRKSTRKCGCS